MLTKTCVVAASCREMAGIHANVPRAPLCCSFALMARSAASFLLLIFPWIDWLHIKVIKFVVAPTGVWEEVSILSLYCWGMRCGLCVLQRLCNDVSSPSLLFLHPLLMFLPSLSPPLDFQLMLLRMLWGVCCALLCRCLFFANIVAFELKGKKTLGWADEEEWERSREARWVVVWRWWNWWKERNKISVLFVEVND